MPTAMSWPGSAALARFSEPLRTSDSNGCGGTPDGTSMGVTRTSPYILPRTDLTASTFTLLAEPTATSRTSVLPDVP